MTTALAASAGRSAAGCVATAAAVLSGQLSVGWSNDAIDAPRDRRTQRLDKPIVLGEVRRQTVARVALAAAVAAVPLSFLSGWAAALAHVAAIALAWAYNLGLKSTRLSVLTYAVAFALLPAFVTLGLPGHPAPPLWAIGGAALLGAGAHLANALPDLEDDVATGVLGLPQRLGPDWSRTAAAVLLLAASATLLLGPSHGAALLACAVAGSAALAAIVLGSAAHPRWAFQAAMALAGADVVFLLASGNSL